MKTNQIKRAVLAAAILAGAGMAYGNYYVTNAVVYCKATIVGDSGNQLVSVTLPPTEGYYDNNGNPLTYWNVGNVPAGGVADSWHGEGGPGRFTAHNEGNVGAYFYVTSGDPVIKYWKETASNVGVLTGLVNSLDSDQRYTIFGSHLYLCKPCISPRELIRQSDMQGYHLAFTTDTVAKVPTWHSLDHRYDLYFSVEERDSASSDSIAGYMGYVDAGDYLTFDLKFWAPTQSPAGYVPVMFTFCVNASPFPLWDHGRGVE